MGRILVMIFAVILPAWFSYLAIGIENQLNFLKIAFGAIGFSMMATNILLSTRFIILDRLFGGLDQVYWIHKWTGISVLFLIVPHEFLQVQLEGHIVTSDLSNFAANVGEFVFWPIIFLIFISFFKRIIPPFWNFEIPYQMWRLSHRVFGLLFIGVFLHQLLIKAPYDNNALIANYLNWLGLAAVMAFLWSQVSYFIRTKVYEVINIRHLKTATIVDLKPIGKGIKIQPGGFAFVSFRTKNLKEPHPFTVSKIEENGNIQFSIRSLGDYTSKIRERLIEGTKARIEGGFGQFDWRKGSNNQIWLAAGIGITPFLAWADSLSAEDATNIDLVYVVRDKSESIGLERLRSVQSKVPTFRFRLYESAIEGRLDANKLLSLIEGNISKSSFWYCGPTQLRVGLIEQLKLIGSVPQSVHFERFEFR